jgi:hypothetical protein
LSTQSIRGLNRRIQDYCRQKVSTVLSPQELTRLQVYVAELIDDRAPTPRRGENPDWSRIGEATGIAVDQLKAGARVIRPALDAIDRTLAALRPLQRPALEAIGADSTKVSPSAPRRSRRGRPPGPVAKGLEIEPHPRAPAAGSPEPPSFDAALDIHMRRFGDSAPGLLSALLAEEEVFDPATIRSWRRGDKTPQSVGSLEVLRRIEGRYGLPDGYFADRLPDRTRAAHGHRVQGISPSEHRRLAWHLPHDFAARPLAEREEILDWVRTVVITGSTDYRRYQASASKTPFALHFPGLAQAERDLLSPTRRASAQDRLSTSRRRLAPERLRDEMARLIAFKTATLTSLGYQRSGVWGAETASQKIEHLSLMFGALAAEPSGAIRGAGVPLELLTLGLLVFPRVWDWYLQWRSDRRGFFTSWEVEMLNVGVALTRKDTGWLRQCADLAEGLAPVPGLVTAQDIETARSDWDGTCERLYAFALARSKEVLRVKKVHRDPFEPILPILEAESPVGEYRKIADEILRLMPDERWFPKATAEAVRSWLLIRLGLHLGLRQKNLRQLLVCPRGSRPQTERSLEDLKRGELRWSDRDHGWEVLIPAVAFKNSHSTFFGKKPYRLILPDLGGLYEQIDAWLERHRPLLLGDARDPRTLFVKTVKRTSTDAAYNQTTFYEVWRLTIQRYGIYNPWTERGAVAGLLPHGPHNVRDVLATHILKQTGSYEQASYAIQDTPDTVAEHYGRFLPQDKAALAAQILNRVWEET